MPIYVTVYHLDKTIIGKTEGEVTLTDIEGYLDDIVRAKAVRYRKIFDATSGTSVLSPQDVETLRDRHHRRSAHAGLFRHSLGPALAQRDDAGSLT